MENDDEKRPKLIKYLNTLNKEQLISMLADVASNYDDGVIYLCNSDAYEISYLTRTLSRGKVQGHTR